MKLYMFQTVPLSIIRSYSLYTQQWYKSYRFVDSCRAAGSGWNSSCRSSVSDYISESHFFLFPFRYGFQVPSVLILNLYVRKRFVLGNAFCVCVLNNSMKDTHCITQFCDTNGQVTCTIFTEERDLIKM
jgi:hypothetical protein